MKDARMLVWITQLGLSVATPLAGFILLGLWLQHRFSMGKWVVILGCVIGMISAVDGLRSTLKTMAQMDRKDHPEEKTLSFNSHD